MIGRLALIRGLPEHWRDNSWLTRPNPPLPDAACCENGAFQIRTSAKRPVRSKPGSTTSATTTFAQIVERGFRPETVHFGTRKSPQQPSSSSPLRTAARCSSGRCAAPRSAERSSAPRRVPGLMAVTSPAPGVSALRSSTRRCGFPAATFPRRRPPVPARSGR